MIPTKIRIRPTIELGATNLIGYNAKDIPAAISAGLMSDCCWILVNEIHEKTVLQNTHIIAKRRTAIPKVMNQRDAFETGRFSLNNAG